MNGTSSAVPAAGTVRSSSSSTAQLSLEEMLAQPIRPLASTSRTYSPPGQTRSLSQGRPLSSSAVATTAGPAPTFSRPLSSAITAGPAPTNSRMTDYSTFRPTTSSAPARALPLVFVVQPTRACSYSPS